MIPSKLAKRAVEEGIFSRATARRTRNLAAEMFAPRYLTERGVAASRLKFLLEILPVVDDPSLAGQLHWTAV